MSALYYYSFIHLLVLLTNMYGVQYVPGIKLDAREKKSGVTPVAGVVMAAVSKGLLFLLACHHNILNKTATHLRLSGKEALSVSSSLSQSLPGCSSSPCNFPESLLSTSSTFYPPASPPGPWTAPLWAAILLVQDSRWDFWNRAEQGQPELPMCSHPRLGILHHSIIYPIPSCCDDQLQTQLGCLA